MWMRGCVLDYVSWYTDSLASDLLRKSSWDKVVREQGHRTERGETKRGCISDSVLAPTWCRGGVLEGKLHLSLNHAKVLMEETSTPIETFYEFIWLKLMTIARKQNLSGVRKCSREWQFRCLFYTLKSNPFCVFIF